MKTKLAISAAAVLLAVAHNLFPAIKADATTVVFVVLALLPWSAPLVKSLELPGGFKIELREVKEAAERVLAEPRLVGGQAEITGRGFVKAEAAVVSPADRAVERLQQVAAKDPNLALVGAGIEIEKRLLELAEERGLDTSRRSVAILVQELQRMGAVPSEVAGGLRDLMALRNQAAHGAYVTPAAATWVLDVLPAILAELDQLAQAPIRSPASEEN